MEQETAMEFYKKVVSGTDAYKTVTLTTDSGHELTGVEMHPVSKKTLAAALQRLPDELLETPDNMDKEELEDLSDEELQEMADGGGTDALTEEAVAAFEELCVQSLNHPELVERKMGRIVSELSFETLYELGSEIMEYSIEETGDVQSFHVQE